MQMRVGKASAKTKRSPSAACSTAALSVPLAVTTSGGSSISSPDSLLTKCMKVMSEICSQFAARMPAGITLLQPCRSTLNHIQHRATDTQVYSDTLPYVSKSVFCILSPPARATSRSRERGWWLARGDDHRAATRVWQFSAHERHSSTTVGGWRSNGGRDRCCPRQHARKHHAGTVVTGGTRA